MSEQTRQPRNVQACLDWFEEHRRDEIHYVRALLDADAAGNEKARAMLGLLLQGFEAGRAFQRNYPELPLGGGLHYMVEAEPRLRVGDRVRMLEGKPVLRTDVGFGEPGTVTVCDDDLVAIRLDQTFSILDEWDNELVWTPDDLADDAVAATVPEFVAGLVEPLDEPNDRETLVREAADFLDGMADGRPDQLGRTLRRIRRLLEG